MCGRFTLKEKKKVKKKHGLDVTPSFNITPSTDVLVFDQKAQPSFLQWGYSPAWSQEPMNLINARSETLHEKPSFKNALRCIFVTDGWYEWQRTSTKSPYYHHLNGELIYFGGIYNASSGCAIVTKQAHKNIAFVHHRQPVLLREDDFSNWLTGEDVFKSVITDEIECYPVSTKVNNPKNNSPDNLVKFQTDLFG